MTDERMQFVARRLAGEPMAELCREFGISRKTGYKTFDAMAVFEQILLGSGLTTREVARPLTRKYSGGRTYNFRVARHSGTIAKVSGSHISGCASKVMPKKSAEG